MAVELDSKTSQVFEQIKELSFLQTAQLVKAFEDEFGISAAAPAAAAAPIAAAAVEAVEEQTDFTLVLLDAGATKIQVLKEVRAITGLGLKEAKDLVDSTPKTVKEGLKKEEAEELKKKLEELGAKIELK
ncbi:MAG: 50S ribosomal protein L7/L12 [Vampirovibrionales bacterium]|nr:50S ribosomal protein L7/L12 [Vampirovibrionales bacterium]